MPLARFKDRLRVPPVLRPTCDRQRSPATLAVHMVAHRVRLHSELPPTDVWTYEGHLPGPRSRSGVDSTSASNGSTLSRFAGHTRSQLSQPRTLRRTP